MSAVDLSAAPVAGQAPQIAAQRALPLFPTQLALGMGFRLGANFWTFYAIGVAALVAALAGHVGLGFLLWSVMR